MLFRSQQVKAWLQDIDQTPWALVNNAGITGQRATVTRTDLADAALAAAGYGNRYVGLLGTRYTMEQDFYRKRLTSFTTLVPPREQRDLVHQVIYDEVTGLVFDLALYRGRGMNMLEMTVFYEWKVWKPEFVATIMG